VLEPEAGRQSAHREGEQTADFFHQQPVGAWRGGLLAALARGALRLDGRELGLGLDELSLGFGELGFRPLGPRSQASATSSRLRWNVRPSAPRPGVASDGEE
jgi:hypothetical protein